MGSFPEDENGCSDTSNTNKGKTAVFLTSSWTESLPQSAAVELFCRTDYSRTALGPIADFGPALRFYISMLFADNRSACLYWGVEHRIAIYNDQFAPLIGRMHPEYMGMSFFTGFPEIAEPVGKVFAAGVQTGRTVQLDDACLFVERAGFLEETWWINQFIPIRGDSGELEGCYNTAMESTAQVLAERRRKVIDAIAIIDPHHGTEQTLALVIDALSRNPKDITMALLYTSEDTGSSDIGDDLRMCGSIGFPKGHHAAPQAAHLATSDKGFIPFFRQARATGDPVRLSEQDGSLSAAADLLHGIEWAGFGEPSRDIVIHALTTITGVLLGFCVLGTNPRLAFDEKSRSSAADLTRQLVLKWSSSISAEQARFRERALQRRLSDSETRLRLMANYAPIGFVQISLESKVIWANQQFHKITGHNKPDVTDLLRSFYPQRTSPDAPAKDLAALFSEGDIRVREVEFPSRRFKPPVEGEKETSVWALIMCLPLLEDGKLKLVMGYVSEISHQKWAESVQARTAHKAVEAKQQQEDFIDTTSHEMRNPLTAMIQLAEGVSRCLEETEPATLGDYRALTDSNIEAARTILACCAHQKRVIDDVLILSRLDSEMLTITPIPAKPCKVVSDIVKMYAGECELNHTSIDVKKDPASDETTMQYVLVDTSRLSQVLMNLLSNAIKFTASQPVRQISLSWGITTALPPSITTAFGPIDWASEYPPAEPHKALPTPGSSHYIYFCVSDNGPGITAEQMKRLFKRFSQATNKTHIKYGGSGMGLYICRQLAIKQGGNIGVASRQGEGSCFAFYLETRFTNSPRLNSRSSSTASIRPKPSTHPRSVAKKSDPSELSVLLVEDNLINQRILAKQLRVAKCHVQVANHGQECLDLLEKSDCWHVPPDPNPIKVDAILLDWEMPVMNGIDCCKRIRELQASGQITRHVPVILTTANVRFEQQELALSAGVDRIVTKPFTVAELLVVVREVVVGETEGGR